MNKEKDPTSVISNKKNKTKLNKKRIIIGLSVVFVAVFSFYVCTAVSIKKTYENMNISFKSVKEIEYGTANYNPLDLVKDVKEGSIKSYTKNIDTSKVGEQEIVFEVAKGDIVKKFKVKVSVKDTTAPEIKVTNQEIAITEGDTFDINSNIELVNDTVDGNLPYNDGTSTEKAYYTIATDLDTNKAGDYTVNVNAVDQNGNTSQVSYKVKVNAKKVAVPTQTAKKAEPTYNGPSSVDTSSVIAAAYSLIGTKYTPGGTNPSTGFDCSGFVSYVFGVTGTSIGRSSSAQLSNGVAVSESDLQPGDIIIWANNGSNSASHTSIYAGNNTIIHATSNKGVQATSLSSWKTWGQHIIGIRRV